MGGDHWGKWKWKKHTSQTFGSFRANEKGHIFLKDTLLKKWSDRELYEKAGFVFQNPELQFIQDTVFDEIAFGGRQRNWPESVVQEKTVQLLEEFGLEKHAKAHPFTLSLGQKED